MTELAHVLRHVRQSAAHPALLVGLDAPDDAGVYLIAPDIALVQTVDFFTPIVDDPYAWGWIAAANAMSDVYAMGGRPATALNLVAWPRDLDFDLLGRVLDGGRDACEKAEVVIVGGHSVDDPEPKFGLAVTGTVRPERIVRNTGARAGADLILTKPLGMGIISTGIKEGLVDPGLIERATRIMMELNAGACEAMLETGVQACTDVTGFGLIGHLLTMLDDGTSAQLDYDAIPVLEEAIDLAGRGLVPGGSRRNYEATRDVTDTGDLDEARRAVVFDAQTSGGLLIAVDPSQTDTLVAALRARAVEDARRIGTLTPAASTIKVVVR
jgi:selenide, water dikinase